MNMLREYLGNNKLYQQSGFHKKQKLGVNKKSVILTCMDSRSLIVCQDVLGCDKIYVIHHTDCGGHAALYHPASFLEHAKYKAKEVLGVGEGGINMHPVYGLDQSVREDVEKLRKDDKIKLSTALYGLVFETESGALREVCSDVRQPEA
ncbi:hypothetical protein N2152v2_001361 [Parachlorella kessleri]